MGGAALIAQVTVDGSAVVTVNAQGLSADGGDDWQQEGITFYLGGASTFAEGAATPVVEQTATSEYGTTYQLSLELSSAEANVYTIYGSSDSNGGSAGGSCEDTYTEDAANVYHIFE